MKSRYFLSPVAFDNLASTGGAMNRASHHHHSGFSLSSGTCSIASMRLRVGAIIAGIVMFEVKLEIGLADRLIVGVRGSRAEFPVKLLSHSHHGFAVGLAVRRIRNGHKARIKCGEGPILIESLLGPRELPVADLASSHG